MPDVTRSDSQRSDASLRPRVSFNRDVHVKRIVPRESELPPGALNVDGAGHLATSPVRRERLKKTKRELEKEAALVLQQADTVDCISQDRGVAPDKFYTLPTRKQQKQRFHSLDRKVKRRNSIENSEPPKKPPRTYVTPTPNVSKTQKPSLFDIFKKKEVPKKSNLRRSVSDATNSKSKTYGPQSYKRPDDLKETHASTVKNTKKQLSSIIEDTQRDSYFAPIGEENKENEPEENLDVRPPARKKWKKTESANETLKKYIDEIDEALYQDTGVRVNHPNKQQPKQQTRQPEVVIIDLDKAEQISSDRDKSIGRAFGKKFKSLTSKKPKNEAPVKQAKEKAKLDAQLSTGSLIQNKIDELVHEKPPDMIHSSQKPVEKLPLTRGRTVDTMVKRLSHDSSSPPPKTNLLVTPNVSVQHNHNQPFSYTRGLSPDKMENPSSPVIYAQVVCNNNGTNKQTVHYPVQNGSRKHLQNSDSDEGLGNEDQLHLFNRRYGSNEYKLKHSDEYFKEMEKFDEESPIVPKFRTSAFTNGYSYDSNKYEHFDSSSRGRADGMDAKRRESLTENLVEAYNPKVNGRTDLSARRDLLESRMNKRLNDTRLRTSPEYSPRASSSNNVYISESSKYHSNGLTSPVGYKETYQSESRTDRNGEKYVTESKTKKYFGDRHKNGYSSYELEPKSFDSHISDYRSSPESRNVDPSSRKSTDRYNQKLTKNRSVHQSNPEIAHRQFAEENLHQESYHNSLRRDANHNYKATRQYEISDRKDKFGDSGIENDFRRDSGEGNYPGSRQSRNRRDFNESEDEGFASSLLIASERQHAAEDLARRNREYDSDRAYSREEDYKSRTRHEYIPRERSIDDGSHFDPRLDKFEKERIALKKLEKKPPKAEKKSSLEKVKQLFTRDSKKKKEKEMIREEALRARYKEYRGSSEQLEPKAKVVSSLNSNFDYSNRRRLSTPSPSPSPPREIVRNPKNNVIHGSWFKSLDRLTRKKTKKDEKEGNFTSTEEETPTKPHKNLRFFGDTDLESNDSIRHKTVYKTRSNGLIQNRNRSQSTRDLHNISEERRTPDIHHAGHHKSPYKSMMNLSNESDRENGKRSKMNSKPPMSPNHRTNRDTPSRMKDERSRRRKNELSSVESSTEGDSSQQSQRSMVYLHAATVGDIPGPNYLRNGRRAASREELASNSSSRLQQPHVKTLSRSFSVLAPWKPKHYREGMDIDYTQYPKPIKNGKYEKKNASGRRENSSTLKKKAHETRRSNHNVSNLSTGSKSKSKENLSTLQRGRSREESGRGSSSTLYKKKDKLPRENSRYTTRDDRKISSKSMSVESLGSARSAGGSARKPREDSNRDISRSISMPRDPEKSAGWFRITKKSHKK